VRCAVVILALALGLARADSITRLPGNPVPSRSQNPGRRLAKYGPGLRRQPGLSPIWNSSLWPPARKAAGRPAPILATPFQANFSATLGMQEPPRTTTERDVDFFLSVLKHFFVSHEGRIMSVYRGCKKSRDADTCAYAHDK